MTTAQEDQEIGRYFDGADLVEVPMRGGLRSQGDVLRVASLYGYRITGESRRTYSYGLVFRRDDTPAVRAHSVPFGYPPPPPVGPHGTVDPVVATRVARQEADLQRLRRRPARAASTIVVLPAMAVVALVRGLPLAAGFLVLLAALVVVLHLLTGRRLRSLEARATAMERQLATAPPHGWGPPAPRWGPPPQQPPWR
ncbi:hypothetical protein [Allostreptomyces psammosilenae]|uniref:Uncharacterized protein n=1 Tax=Allostreptomyces psammosilenae TaxID=1892865 RepID=A0A853A767_9ACTN|nr:hypothetical protein [Allostreptomyces psammosilenae]NYI06511.1 hypothetical protein [Allostreptomyces psammosilenae]